MAAPSHGDAERGEVEGQYGAAARGAVRETVTSRAWALGAVVLTCAVLGGAHVMTRQGPAMLATAGKSWVVPAAVPSSAQVTSSLQSAAAERHIERLLKQDVAAEGAELTTLPIHHPGPYMVKKASFTKGEKHMMQEIFPTRASKDELQRDMPSIDQLVPPELLTELENEIAREMEAEVQDAVRKEQQEYYLKSTGTIQAEMDAVMRDVDGQKQINSKFNEMLARAKVLEKDICTSSSQPCKNWDALLAGAQKKADSLKKRLAAETVTRKHALQIERAKERDETAMSYMAEERGESLQEDIKYWQGLANVYFAILHPHTPPPAPAPVPPSPPPPPPPPPHCKGLKVIYGLSGSVSTGPSSSVTDPMHNDCRWIIKSPDSEIVLRFPEIKLPGDEARVSIYVGPENVALYAHEDVINWSSAFRSFTGMSFPAPIVCHSNEVLVVFHTSASEAAKSSMDMTWTSGVEASARATVDDALASPEETVSTLAAHAPRPVQCMLANFSLLAICTIEGWLITIAARATDVQCIKLQLAQVHT